MVRVLTFLADGYHDYAILAITAVLFAAFGLTVSWLAHHVWFRFWPVRGDEDQKLADTVETSLLASFTSPMFTAVFGGVVTLAVAIIARQRFRELRDLKTLVKS